VLAKRSWWVFTAIAAFLDSLGSLTSRFSGSFETFPLPEPTEEQRKEIAEAARRLDGQRRNWLDPEGASEAELKKLTLTNLYNAARRGWTTPTRGSTRRSSRPTAGGRPADEEILKKPAVVEPGAF
jgi:hypothetical protein